MQDTYTGNEHSSFEVLKIFPLKTLALETKAADKFFEEYDPNQIILKVNPWRWGITVLDEDKLQPKRMKFSKEDTMQKFLEDISKETQILLKHLVLLKCRAIGQGKNVEELSLNKNKPRKLKALRVNDGLNLFVENGSFEHPDLKKYAFLSQDKSTSKQEIEFELDRNRFTLKYNVPSETDEKDHTDGNIDYNKQIIINKRMSILELKADISKELDIGLEELIFNRITHGTEIKEDDLSLKQASLYIMACLYIRKGIPSHLNEKRLKFMLAEEVFGFKIENPNNPVNDSLFYQITELIEIPVNTYQTTLKVKKFI